MSQVLPELVIIATKDSKIKLVNIDKGESYKSIPFTSNGLIDDGSIGTPLNLVYPLEMTIIERDSKPCNSNSIKTILWLWSGPTKSTKFIRSTHKLRWSMLRTWVITVVYYSLDTVSVPNASMCLTVEEAPSCIQSTRKLVEPPAVLLSIGFNNSNEINTISNVYMFVLSLILIIYNI